MPPLQSHRLSIVRLVSIILPLLLIVVVSAALRPRAYLPITMRSKATPTSTTSIPSFSHVFIIVMENEAYDRIIGNPDAPYINSLAEQYAVASPAWQQKGMLFLTFDESNPSDDSGCCQYAAGGHLLTLVISPLVTPAYQSQVAYDHYSLLRTIEMAWSMPLLNKASCDCSQPMADFFHPTANGQRP
jgi:hypothetical protein